MHQVALGLNFFKGLSSWISVVPVAVDVRMYKGIPTLQSPQSREAVTSNNTSA